MCSSVPAAGDFLPEGVSVFENGGGIDGAISGVQFDLSEGDIHGLFEAEIHAAVFGGLDADEFAGVGVKGAGDKLDEVVDFGHGERGEGRFGQD